jgi:hypothetical protein
MFLACDDHPLLKIQQPLATLGLGWGDQANA